MTRARHLDWPGCYNVRDLGGLPLQGGGTTRWGAIVRADDPSRLTSEGIRAALDYGVRSVVDLRWAAEVAETPSPFLDRTDASWVRYHHRPVDRRDPAVSAKIMRAASRGEIYTILLDHYPDLNAAALRAVPSGAGGTVLIHCHSGKDRTGVIVALLLALAGVPDAAIVADYAESQRRLRPLYEAAVAAAGGEEHLDFWQRPTATADMMVHTLNHLEARYGGARGYLRSAGMGADELDALAALLREV